MRTVTIHYTMDLCRWILNWNESTIIKVHDLLANAWATYSINPREPCLIFAPAREPIILMRPLEEEMSNRRVMWRLFHVNSGAIGQFSLQWLSQDRIKWCTHLAVFRTNMLPTDVHSCNKLQTHYWVPRLCCSIQIRCGISHVHGCTFQIGVRRVNKCRCAHLKYIWKLNLNQLVSDLPQYILCRLWNDSTLIY